jgi:hypothetical protein
MSNLKNVMDLNENDVLADGRVVQDLDAKYWDSVDQVFVVFDDGSFQAYAPFDQVPMGGVEFLAP